MNKDKILIVEDEEDTRFILERLLTKNNFEVKTSVNGLEALDVLKEYSPKVIVADWTMPKIDGIQLCDIIKKDQNTKHIYFILLTARASLRDRVAGLDIGADDFLVKPIENQELIARIRSGIRIFNLQNELKSIEHNKALIEIATTIGHNINNPLSSLLISVRNLETELASKLEDSNREDFEIIKESIQRIEAFVTELVNLKNPELENYVNDQKMLKISDSPKEEKK